jgi:hypothetical protein
MPEVVTDSRWSDVEADVEQALKHFGMAIEIFVAGGFDDPGIEGYNPPRRSRWEWKPGTPQLSGRFLREFLPRRPSIVFADPVPRDSRSPSRALSLELCRAKMAFGAVGLTGAEAP